MRKMFSIVMFGMCTLLFAQDQNARRNVIGWESGLTYRRYLTDKLWVGVTLGGNINDTRGKDTSISTYVYTSPDSTVTRTTYTDDTSRTYKGTIKATIGRELLRFQSIGLDAFFSGGYTYVTSKSVKAGTNGSNYKNPSQMLFGTLGLEPKVWIWSRVSVATQFGLQYEYQWYRYNNSYAYDNPSSSYSNNEAQSSTEQNVHLFGCFSLSMGLNVYFLF
jgi:hypothetical protein